MTWYHRVHTEWQLQLFDIHSIMMEKSAQPGENGGCTPNPFTISTVMYKVVVYATAARADTLPLFPLYPYMYSVLCTVSLHMTLDTPFTFGAVHYRRNRNEETRGSHIEMSSILADQRRPRIWAQMRREGVGGLRGLSQWVHLCTRSPKSPSKICFTIGQWNTPSLFISCGFVEARKQPIKKTTLPSCFAYKPCYTHICFRKKQWHTIESRLWAFNFLFILL
jgi:hypothetical protein